MDIAVVGVGINVTMSDSGICEEAKVSIGAVAEKALVVEDAATALVGNKITDEIIENFISKVRASARPINDKRGTVDFRIQVIGVIAKRALKMALERIR
jgi:carbon-monoxide dehydrogenase medium subunit